MRPTGVRRGDEAAEEPVKRLVMSRLWKWDRKVETSRKSESWRGARHNVSCRTSQLLCEIEAKLAEATFKINKINFRIEGKFAELRSAIVSIASADAVAGVRLRVANSASRNLSESVLLA